MKNLLTLLFLLFFGSASVYCQLNWEHTGGPNGGRLSRIYASDNYAFYPDENFLYRTSDGQNWEQLPQHDIWPMATNGNKLAAQFDVNYGSSLGLQPKFKVSYDNGDTWVEKTYPTQAGYFSEITWCSHGIYVPSYSDQLIYRSTDEGQSWNSFALPVSYIDEIKVFEDRIYITDFHSFWRSDSNGENWENIQIPLGSNEYISNIFANGQHIVVSTKDNIWHSHDNGSTWASQPGPWFDDFENLILVNGNVYLTGGGSRIARTSDFGLSWDLLVDDDSYDLNVYYAATVDGELLGSTYSKGVFRFNDTINEMVEANNGLASAAVFNITSGGNKVWAGAGNGLFDLNVSTGTWNNTSSVPSPDNFYEIIVANDNGLVCVSEWLSYKLYISSDFGQNWIETFPFDGVFSSGYIDNVQIIDNNIFVWDDFYENFVHSSDFGLSWQQIDNFDLGITNIVKFNGVLLGVGFNGTKIFTSSNGGTTWSLFTEFSNGYITGLKMVGDRLLSSRSEQINGTWKSRLYTSLDGINWTYANDGLPDDIRFFDFYDIDYNKPGLFSYSGEFFGHDPSLGIFASTDSCKTWFPLEFRPNNSITLYDDSFYVGSFGGGVFRSTIPENLYGELITGTVFKDDNNNGIQDGSEVIIPNVKVGINQPNAWYPFYFSSTDENGKYSLGITPNLQDTLRPLMETPYIESINPPSYIANSGGVKNFGVHLTPNIHDLEVDGSYFFRPRPGFDLLTYARINNIGTENETTTASLKLDPMLSFIEATPSPTAVIGDSLVWDLGTIPVLNNEYIFVKTNLSTLAPLGSWVKSTWRVSGQNTDIQPFNNLSFLCDTVVGSFDPNEKIVEPAVGLSEAEIAAGKELLCTIRFQNTGTFPAERVRITDLLDTALYLPSLRLVAASHPVTSFNLKPGGLLEVLFDNIQLPDSTNNEPESHGFVTFAVQRNKAYNKDYPVRNTASIYFDFNEPIFTNEVSFTVNPNNVSSAHEARPKGQVEELLIFPNPTSASFTVSSKGKLSGQGSLVLVNSMGQILEEQQVGNLANPIRLKTNDLPEGIYFVKISGGKGFMSGRVVVQRGH